VKSRLDLRFEGQLEEDFLAESYLHGVAAIRVGLVLAAVLYALFGVLDRYMLPQTQGMAWVIRYAVMGPALTLVLFATFSRWFAEVWVPAVAFVCILLGAGILGMMWASERSEPGYAFYYSGLMLVIIWIGTFSQLGFRQVTATVGAIIAGFLYVSVERHGMATSGFANPDFPVFVNNSFFLFGAAVLAVFASHALETARRRRFLQTREISREREKTQGLLERVETLLAEHVSTEVASELVDSGGAIQPRACDVTVMFIDIRDFTAYADSRSPGEVAYFQNAVFSEVIEIIQAHRGIVNQLLGDGVMATFGAPVPSESHAADAVAAGLRILAAVGDLGASGKIPEIRLGIGLHTGTVLAGNIGAEHRKQYSLTGRTVTIASRIEQLNKVHGSQFLVSGDVWACLDDDSVSAQHLGAVELRGIGQPVDLYRLA
jgi:class 3 adenylate cyclase